MASGSGAKAAKPGEALPGWKGEGAPNRAPASGKRPQISRAEGALASGAKAAKPGEARPRLKDQEVVVYGLNACMAAFKKRPADLLRVFFHESRRQELKEVTRWCRARKLPYRELDIESLNKVAASVHHEGVAMVVRPLLPLPLTQLMKGGLTAGSVLVALDGVENPHNIGAIARSAAYFGACGLVVEAGESARALPPSAVRMAEGGLESVPCYQTGDMPSAIRDLRGQGLFILGADAGAALTIQEAALTFPLVLVLGSEGQGLSERARKRCDALVRIPGSGQVESLNVSVAAGVLLAEVFRRRPKA